MANAGQPLGPPPGPPTVSPASGTPGSGAIVAALLVVAGLLVSVGAVVFTLREGETSAGSAAGGEIFLESAANPGTNPFTEPVDPGPVAKAVTVPTSTAGGTTTGPAPASVPPVSQPTSGVAPPPGSSPYGGSGDDSVCDREKLISFLTANGERARAWAAVLGVSVDDIPTYVRGLTPTVLLYDTRVTNHGFINGRATAFQSLLQAGTAVLVDAKGNPVVRCRCGNPLFSPQVVAKPVVRGEPWPGYNPSAVVAINNGATFTVAINVAQPPQPGPGPTPSPTPSTATTASSVPPGQSTSTTSEGTDLGVAPQHYEGLLAVLAECTNTVQVLDARMEPDSLGVITVRARVDGVEMVLTYEPATGSVGEGDRASADFLARCAIQ